MKRFLLFILLTSLISCSTSKEEQLKHLAGYWEIEKVLTETGEEKTFLISTSVDFIEVEDTTGKRTKLQPQLDGSFINNDNTEVFTIDTTQDHIVLKYKTPFATWDETILKATKEKLQIVNSEGKTYFYKRFEKFDFDK